MNFNKEEFSKELKEYCKNKTLPFWKNLKDDEFGGFYGFVDFDLNLDKKAIKGCILHSRILWFFASAYLEGYGDELLEYADHAFDYLKEVFLDQEYGGLYWSVQYDGTPYETIKYTYNQAFCIYALSTYYDASKKKEALELAYELYNLIESKSRDEIGYLEAFTKEWVLCDNDKLSENGVMAEKTMNTYLHLLEAYTEFYRVTQDERVADDLRFILDKFATNVYNPKLHRQEVFFDKNLNSLIDLHSYGHDIETCWLLDRGTKYLNDPVYTEKMKDITRDMAEEIFRVAYKDHSILSECDRGVVNAKRSWWPQCEGVIGFYNEYQKSGREEYANAAYDIWQFILTYIDDKRSGGEWYSEVDEVGNPIRKPIVEPWKCPYHNGRMYFEMVRRLKED